jgi:hypothetical protein
LHSPFQGAKLTAQAAVPNVHKEKPTEVAPGGLSFPAPHEGSDVGIGGRQSGSGQRKAWPAELARTDFKKSMPDKVAACVREVVAIATGEGTVAERHKAAEQRIAKLLWGEAEKTLRHHSVALHKLLPSIARPWPIRNWQIRVGS